MGQILGNGLERFIFIMLKINDFCPPSARHFELAFRGVRFSWGSNNRSDSVYLNSDFILGSEDKKLLTKLISAGPSHSKFLRQLPVLIDFEAPEFFLKEWDTYKIGTVSNRSSMMHTLGKVEFSESMFDWEHTPNSFKQETLDNLNILRSMWIDAGKRKGPEAERWLAMVEAIPQSWYYRTLWSGSYETLRTMFFQRRNHRLPHWRQFCGFIKDLPHSELITVEG